MKALYEVVNIISILVGKSEFSKQVGAFMRFLRLKRSQKSLRKLL